MSNRSQGAKSGWMNRMCVIEYPFEVTCRVQWQGQTATHSSFRAKCYSTAHDIALAVVDALVEPNDIRIEINGPKNRLIHGPPQTVRRLLGIHPA